MLHITKANSRRRAALMSTTLVLAFAGGVEASLTQGATSQLFVFTALGMILFGSTRGARGSALSVDLGRLLLMLAASTMGPLAAVAIVALRAAALGLREEREHPALPITEGLATLLTVGLAMLLQLHAAQGSLTELPAIGLTCLWWLLVSSMDALQARLSPSRGARGPLLSVRPLDLPIALAITSLGSFLREPADLFRGVVVGSGFLTFLFLTWTLQERAQRQGERLQSLAQQGHGLLKQNIQTAKALVGALDTRMGLDPRGPSRVASLARTLGRLSGLGPVELSELELAAILRDVGSAFVPATHAESGSEASKCPDDHTAGGASLFATAGIPQNVVTAIYSHHERWDGTGSPRRLVRGSIPLYGRILALAELIETSSSTSMDADAASLVARIESESGKALDPALCSLCAAHIKEILAEQRRALAEAGSDPASILEQANSRKRALKLEKLGSVMDRLSSLMASSIHIDDRVLGLARDELATLLPIRHIALLDTSTEIESSRVLASSGLPEHAVRSIWEASNDPDVSISGVLLTQVPGESIQLILLADAGPDLEELRWVGRELTERIARLLPASRAFDSMVLSASTDPLTGIGNRRALDTGLTETLLYSQESRSPFTLLALDLNELKPLNDRFGHSTGDQAIRSIAHALQSILRNRDVAARTGGDEFVALLRDCDPDGAEQALSRLLDTLGATSIMLPDGTSFRPSVAVGVASWPQDGLAVERLLELADERMYENKRAMKVHRDQKVA